MLVAVVRLRRDPLRLTLSEPFGARLTDAEATGTIINTDALPRAWLARFGRTAAGHMLESVRLSTSCASTGRLIFTAAPL